MAESVLPPHWLKGRNRLRTQDPRNSLFFRCEFLKIFCHSLLLLFSDLDSLMLGKFSSFFVLVFS
jgi:hypothetical protein